MSENFANTSQTTLNGAIDSSTTTVVVTSATGFPSVNFRILIDSELMLVTNVSTNTFTVTRHVESTSAASHSDGATVTHVLTAASLIAAVTDRYAGKYWTSGTSMPGSPTTGDRITRTDLQGGLDFFYDGTRWLSVNMYQSLSVMVNPTAALTATTAAWIYIMLDNDFDIWVERWHWNTNVASGTPSTQYWTAAFYKSTNTASITQIGSTLSTQSDTYGQWNLKTDTVDTNIAVATYVLLRVDITKVSTPGSLTARMGFSYRLIGT